MAKNIGKMFENAKGLGDYAGTAVKTSIVFVTAGLEQLTTLATYRCPCVEVSQIGGCIETVGKNVCKAQLLNQGYGLSFIIAPAIALYIFGIASNPRTWKSVTGMCKKTEAMQQTFTEVCWTLVGIGGQAFIAPVTWVTIAFLDGRYYACAITALPYDVSGANSTYLNCEKVAADKVPKNSNQYQANRSFSQMVGWIVLTAAVLLGIAVYAWTQCSSPLTYYHAKYFQFYNTSELAEFDDEMSKKAQQDAEANVLKFMETPRSKLEWDQISTVYEFHRDKKNLSLYSHLHAWVERQKIGTERRADNEPLNKDEGVTAEINFGGPDAVVT